MLHTFTQPIGGGSCSVRLPLSQVDFSSFRNASVTFLAMPKSSSITSAITLSKAYGYELYGTITATRWISTGANSFPTRVQALAIHSCGSRVNELKIE